MTTEKEIIRNKTIDEIAITPPINQENFLDRIARISKQEKKKLTNASPSLFTDLYFDFYQQFSSKSGGVLLSFDVYGENEFRYIKETEILLEIVEKFSNKIKAIGFFYYEELDDILLSGIIDRCRNITNLSFIFHTVAFYNCGKGSTIVPQSKITQKSLQNLSKLLCLQKLELVGCKNLKTLKIPNSELINVKISDCGKLKELSFKNLPKLINLKISDCGKLKELSFKNLPQLREMSIEWCKNCETITFPGKNSLRNLKIVSCYRINKLSFLKTPGLRKLYLDSVHRIKKLVGLSKLSSLEELYLSGNYTLGSLNINNLCNLKTVCISHFALNSLTFKNLEKLKSVKLYDHILPLLSFWNVPKLEKIEINTVPKLRKILFFGVPNLNILKLNFCDDLETLRGLSTLEKIKWMDLHACRSLRKLEIKNSYWLEELYISSCNRLERVVLAKANKLERIMKRLILKNCPELEKVKNFSKFKILQEVKIQGCKSLLGFGRY